MHAANCNTRSRQTKLVTDRSGLGFTGLEVFPLLRPGLFAQCFRTYSLTRCSTALMLLDARSQPRLLLLMPKAPQAKPKAWRASEARPRAPQGLEVKPFLQWKLRQKAQGRQVIVGSWINA